MGKGIAFVGFKDSAAIPIAIKMDGSTFKKRELHVRKIEKRNKASFFLSSAKFRNFASWLADSDCNFCVVVCKHFENCLSHYEGSKVKFVHEWVQHLCVSFCCSYV